MAAYRGQKYRKLHSHLCGLSAGEWKASFAEVEAIIGDKLPPAARTYRAWWANDITHTHGRAWVAAGWKTEKVNMDAEMLTFRRESIYAPDGQSVSNAAALDALNELQAALAQRGVDLAGWARELRAERRATGP